MFENYLICTIATTFAFFASRTIGISRGFRVIHKWALAPDTSKLRAKALFYVSIVPRAKARGN